MYWLFPRKKNRTQCLVRPNMTSERIELERPGWSGFVANSKPDQTFLKWKLDGCSWGMMSQVQCNYSANNNSSINNNCLTSWSPGREGSSRGPPEAPLVDLLLITPTHPPSHLLPSVCSYPMLSITWWRLLLKYIFSRCMKTSNHFHPDQTWPIGTF